MRHKYRMRVVEYPKTVSPAFQTDSKSPNVQFL